MRSECIRSLRSVGNGLTRPSRDDRLCNRWMQLSTFFVSHGRWTVWTIGVLALVLATVPEPQH
jgi:hypothetical protein